MIKIYHGKNTRSVRAIWMMEEMGLEYEVVPVRFPGARDPEYVKIHPLGILPALADGDVLIYESVASLEYLGRRYGPTPLAPSPDSAAFAPYLQFLHMGEASLAAALSLVMRARFLAPAEHKNNWSVSDIQEAFLSRLGLVAARLKQTPYLAGEAFTAADISVAYALDSAGRLQLDKDFDPVVEDYRQRITGRPAYARAAAR